MKKMVPKAAPPSSGAVHTSWWSAAVKPEKPDTVNFIYNGQPVSYYTITSPVTGRKWLDRNLGAPNTPSGYDDWANKGDLFPWGRPADGHQLVIRAATTGGTTAVNGTTTTRSGNDNPGCNFGDGDFALTVNEGLYWTSRFTPGTWVATQFNFALNGPAYGQASPRTNGLSVRCIKN